MNDEIEITNSDVFFVMEAIAKLKQVKGTQATKERLNLCIQDLKALALYLSNCDESTLVKTNQESD